VTWPWSPLESSALEEPTSEAREVPVWEMPGADGASLGTASVKVDGAGPQSSDDTGGLLQDLVMRGAVTGVPRSATLGDAVPAPASSDTTGPGVSGLLLSDSPGIPPPPINWRQVGEDVEFTCSWVTTAERLLHETLASVDRNIPCLFL
jgi:hypothetical protein